jgi:hypothetical protein
MLRSVSAVLLLVLLLSGCARESDDSGETPRPMAATSAVATLPTTVEGFLTADVEEGDEDVDGAAEHTFGTLKVGDEEIDVYVPGSVMSTVRLPADGGRVRATIGWSSNEFGSTNYHVTALQRL